MSKFRLFHFPTLIILALVLKMFLFAYAAKYVPQAKFKPDSDLYLKTATTLISQKAFAVVNDNGTLNYVMYRTPGYPLFLGVFHDLFQIPLNGIILIQILLTLLVVVVVYKSASYIDPALATLAGLIILFDPAITVYSLMLLTESLFLLFISLFMLVFILYMKFFKVRWLALAALLLIIATYVRPVSYYLGLLVSLFIICIFIRQAPKKALVHAVLFFVIVYSAIAIWHFRNYAHFKQNTFSTITNATISRTHGTGLLHSYQKTNDPRWKVMPPVAYYINMGSRSLLSLWTRPASFKDFNSLALKYAGKVFSYLWIVFWLGGFLKGLTKIKGNQYFYFLFLVICYFTVVTVLATMWGATARFRIPMMPFIAIISAYGWLSLRKVKNV